MTAALLRERAPASRAGERRAELRSLTGLRGIAATLVMVDHYAELDFAAPFPLDLLPHMYLAVDMFMVLSGFVLAMNYEDRLRSGPPGRGYGVFLLRRIARLFPLYAATTLVCFVLVRAGWLTFLRPDASFGALLANLLAVQSWAWPGSSLNGPGWSISAEWFANLAFPLLVPAMLGRSLARSAAWAVLAFAVLVLTAVLFGQLFDVPSPGAVNTIAGAGALGRCVSEFALGMFCWRLRSRLPEARVLARALAGDRVQLLLLAAMAVLIQFTVLDTLFVALTAVLLLGLSFEASALSARLGCRPLLWLGRISYSTYLIHITLLPARDALAGFLGSRGVPLAWACAVLCCAGLTLALATLSRRCLERPAQAFLRPSG